MIMFAYLLALTLICSPATDKVEQAVKDYVLTTYPMADVEYQFGFRRVNWNIIPDDFDSARVLKIGKDSPLGNTIFTLGVYNQGRLQKAVPISVEVSLLVDALVTTTPINTGQPMEGLIVTKRTITGEGEFPVADSTLLEGKQAKNYISAGSIVYMSMVEAKPVITPGDKVTIVIDKGAIKLTTGGVARQKGSLGDVIRVVNLDSKKIIQAEIIDSVTVAVK
jgi:flagella basal body P-ring formation protein FlgA